MRACINLLKPLTRILSCSLTNQLKLSESLEFQFSLESLLPLMADGNKTIVLAVAGYSYKDMLMSWVCRLRHLQISNFIVSALDEETYEFSILQVRAASLLCSLCLLIYHLNFTVFSCFN